ncbi:hypothetical protein OEIGOIKO_07008 [Streptomyces chrestomyceticus JCM 4735]|uniref:Uncharacterized protein n=1 Tax=Streptomyces chrestomyceticus JCM 4735 TaxID=1306181 RepID=A0A7U9L197_9ACTN|nr:hypothetical protein [Streptomyces chrestomyceticus]GCD39179.1 hypothetical protein OEIGOIKO_07008 [Streptomyces chrestomyceticus JCM 4735]
MMCTLLTTGDGVPGRIAPTLAEIFGVPVPEVDVCDAWDLENRNWEASVTCEYMALDGDLSWSLAITAGDTPHISEEELALAVARSLGVDVIFPSDYPDISWIDRVATPAGEVGYVNTVEEEGEPPRWTVAVSEVSVPAFPHAEVRRIPEIIRPLQLPTPLTDACVPGGSRWRDTVWPLLNWERLTARMEADWPPSGWYPVGMYIEDLELRDQVPGVIAQLPAELQQPVQAALEQVDRTYHRLTTEDGGASLAEAAESSFAGRAWYWHRRPSNPPWDKAN